MLYVCENRKWIETSFKLKNVSKVKNALFWTIEQKQNKYQQSFTQNYINIFSRPKVTFCSCLLSLYGLINSSVLYLLCFFQFSFIVWWQVPCVHWFMASSRQINFFTSNRNILMLGVERQYCLYTARLFIHRWGTFYNTFFCLAPDLGVKLWLSEIFVLGYTYKRTQLLVYLMFN